MNIIIKKEHFLVVDDFLSNQDFAEIQKYIYNVDFGPIETKKQIQTYRTLDYTPLEGELFLSRGMNNQSHKHYPTKSRIDIIFEAIHAHEQKSEIVGYAGQEWNFFSAKPVIYPANTGLAWHDDYADISGAYIYYCHSHWDVFWAGELLISDVHIDTVKHLEKSKTNTGNMLYHKTIFNDESVNHALQDAGCGTYIIPKPNRMVYIKSGYIHKIQKIAPEAGDRFRASVIGFFVKGADSVSC